MLPHAIEIHRFRGWDQGAEIRLDRAVTAIVGENGWGKSSTLDAIGWCLYGREVEGKGSSGIDERKHWDVRHREASPGPTEVTLTLADGDGHVQVVRRRAADASARDDDALTVRLPDGTDLRAEEAGQWITDMLPDWPTFRRAHMQHQAAVRHRLYDAGDRSAALELLLGVADDAWLRDGLESRSHRGSALIKQVDNELAEIEREIERELERPEREIAELRDRIAERGIDRARIGRGLVAEVATEITAAARELAEELGVEADIPSVTGDEDRPDLDALITWAEGWPEAVRASGAVDANLKAHRERCRRLSTAIENAEEGQSELRELQAERDEAVATYGTLAECEATVEAARRALDEAQAQLEEADALVGLLQRARNLVADASEPDRCPVCDQERADLSDHIEGVLERYTSQQLEALQDKRDQAQQRLADAEAALDRVRALGDRVTALQEAFEAQLGTLTEVMDDKQEATDSDDAVHDHLAVARKEVELLDDEIEAAESALNQRDRVLNEHDRALRLLRDLRELEAAERRREARGDVTALDAWEKLQAAVDEVAAFAADQEALAELARDAQVERSKARVAEVNQYLARYVGALLGEEAANGLQVATHRTATRIRYRLRDASGQRFIPISNQAKLNAVSLALLFAQAEAQAQADRLAWVILDDPVQSMDERRQKGLAEAIEQLCEHCRVLVSATPTEQLTRRLHEYVSAPRRIVRLAPIDQNGCVTIEEEEQL